MKRITLQIQLCTRYALLWMRYGKDRALWIAQWRSRHVTSSMEHLLGGRMPRTTGKAHQTEYFNGTAHRR